MSNARNLSDLLGTGSTIATAKIADDAITADKIADTAIVGRRNFIINGSMQIAQRATSSTDANIQTVDRWKIQRSEGITQSQEDLSSSDTPYDYGFRKTLKVLNTSNANAGGTYTQIFQVIEAQDVANSAWDYTSSSSYITIQFWVKSSVAGTYSAWLRAQDGTSKSYSFQFTLVADTWKKVTHSAPGNSSLTINSDNGQGLELFIVPHYGADLTTSSHTDEAWQTYSGTDITGDYGQNWKNTSNSTFFLTGVQIEAGNKATPFDHETVGETLAKCQRYFYKHLSQIWGYQVVSLGTTYARASFIFPVEMRTSPTVSGVSYNSTSGAQSAQFISKNGITLTANPTLSGSGVWYANWQADAEL